MRRFCLFVALLASWSPEACANSAQPRPISVSPAIAGERNTIDVESAREPLPAAIALDMPDMRMPVKHYALHTNGAGLYEASNVDFSMAGTWRVTILDARGNRISSVTVAVR